MTKHYYNQTHSTEREYVEFDEGKTIKIFLCAPFAEVLPRSSNKKFYPQQPLLGKELNNFKSRGFPILFLFFLQIRSPRKNISYIKDNRTDLTVVVQNNNE